MAKPSTSVQSVDRALRILELIAEETEGLRLNEIAERAGLPTSTAHRLLISLEQRRFVHFVRERTVWQVGRAAFRVGAAFVRRRAFIAPAAPMMRALRDETRETVNVAAPDDGEIVIVAQIESREVVRAINPIGGRAPMSTSALGKAILATYDDGALATHVARHGLPRCTVNTIVDPDALRDDLAIVQERGFALDCEEHLMGLHCVAAPVFDARREAVASISISGLATRMEQSRVDAIGAAVAAAAAQLTRDLDGTPPENWMRR